MNPVDDEYGAFTAIYGTLVSSLLALVIAIPLGVGTAIFITENIIPKKIRNVIGLMVELLASIPSVVLGLWAIFILEPLIRPFLMLLYEDFGWIPIVIVQMGRNHNDHLHKLIPLSIVPRQATFSKSQQATIMPII